MLLGSKEYPPYYVASGIEEKRRIIQKLTMKVLIILFVSAVFLIACKPTSEPVE